MSKKLIENKKRKFHNALAKAGGNKSKAAQILGLKRTTFTYQLKQLNVENEYFSKKTAVSKVYIVTAAQTATPVHDGFFKSLLKCKEHRNAELIVIPFRYKNPTSIFTEDQKEGEWWDPKVLPYLSELRQNLCKHLTVLGDIKIRPTAVVPLSGLESISGHKSCIVAHSKLQLSVVASSASVHPKLMTTTGCLTVSNYTDSKEGKKGEFHHTLAACIVEVKPDGTFNLRQLNCVKDGSFIDLDTEYTSTGIKKAGPALALITGDSHYPFVNKDAIKATFTAKDSMLNRFKPKYVLFHDVCDFYAQNHHHRGNPFSAVAKQKQGFGGVLKELTGAFKYVSDVCGDTIPVFVDSNHPGALTRWMKENDWKLDPENAEFYLETALYMCRNSEIGEGGTSTPDPFKWWGEKLLKSKKQGVFLSKSDTFYIADINCAHHGHSGANGARGSLVGYAKLSDKTITGHSHTPGIRDGAYQVGLIGNKNLEYVGNISSWMHTNCIIYANGKRVLINILDGSYYT